MSSISLRNVFRRIDKVIKGEYKNLTYVISGNALTIYYDLNDAHIKEIIIDVHSKSNSFNFESLQSRLKEVVNLDVDIKVRRVTPANQRLLTLGVTRPNAEANLKTMERLLLDLDDVLLSEDQKSLTARNIIKYFKSSKKNKLKKVFALKRKIQAENKNYNFSKFSTDLQNEKFSNSVSSAILLEELEQFAKFLSNVLKEENLNDKSAIHGGISVESYVGHSRGTRDIDFLASPETTDKIIQAIRGSKYKVEVEEEDDWKKEHKVKTAKASTVIDPRNWNDNNTIKLDFQMGVTDSEVNKMINESDWRGVELPFIKVNNLIANKVKSIVQNNKVLKDGSLSTFNVNRFKDLFDIFLLCKSTRLELDFEKIIDNLIPVLKTITHNGLDIDINDVPKFLYNASDKTEMETILTFEKLWNYNIIEEDFYSVWGTFVHFLDQHIQKRELSIKDKPKKRNVSR